ncbi:MAG: hypothetical protein ACYC5J_15130 [Chloroflexota bacterium]
MPTEYAGVLAIPLIIGLVEAAKRVGLRTVWATPLAIVRPLPEGQLWLPLA